MSRLTGEQLAELDELAEKRCADPERFLCSLNPFKLRELIAGYRRAQSDEAERDETSAALVEVRDERNAAEADLAEAVEVLRPFASECAEGSLFDPTDCGQMRIFTDAKLDVAAFRRARAFVEKHGGGK